MSKYTRQHYREIGSLLGRAKASKKEVTKYVKIFKKDNPLFKKDNPLFKPKLFRDHVKKHRPKTKNRKR